MLDRIILDAVIDPFHGLGLSAKVAETLVEPESARRTASLIAFSGLQLRGSLVLAMPFELLATCWCQQTGEPELSFASAEDWAKARDCNKELVNQLLGRIKNRLTVDGRTIEARTPTVLSGRSVEGLLASRSAEPYRFLVSRRPVIVSLELTSAPSDEAVPSSRPRVHEGEIVYF